ncbi:putative reverse transcriptase domain-containing protein [Tanacetum coccineum]
MVAYNRRFQQLALMCARMFPEEVDKIEKYIGGLPDMILGSVKASKPKTMQEAIEFTTELMDEKTHAYAERQAEKKRKYDDLSKNNQNQQQQNKRQNTSQAYTAGNSDRKPYAGSKPLCSKCNYNHEGPCPPRCNNCKKLGHLAKDCRSQPANTNNNNRNNNNNNQKGNGLLDQHEVHANENRTMMERFLQPTNDPLALVSNASVQQYPTQSSKSPQSSNEPSPADNFQLDPGSSSTENLIESLSN